MQGYSRLVLKVSTVIFLTLTTFIGFISWSNATRKVDKLRYSFLTLGSLISLIFTSNA